ncbi:MORC family CW-type zinc finger protein 3-like [Populus alba x Populus x berolinensis]|uniref:MORC family CW-type zinc finger protein 3-like n=2 Tax=Populus TaxID=3689 RepID=A0A4U5QHS9_POPAL|nr:MORC family CW-type zinc finger protein 3-like [Populus alba x Populus x berolinensis]TKS08627.1 MORC family CW-type zinc finger protein 3-like [Populus alba]
MDVNNSFLEQQVRSTAAKRSSNSLNDCDGNGHSFLKKKPKQERDLGFAVPDRGCLAPVPLRTAPPPLTYKDHQEGHVGVGNNNMNNNNNDNQVAAVPVVRGCKQFWKAGDYEGGSVADSSADHSVGMDHVRVHPKFLHSNATSHKWALGAFAELLDNAVDEVGHGATCVSIDVLNNSKDFSKMLLVEDNGGGMTPDRMRACMSLGYSTKSKMANTIGQYGNGFKTSTMRLGADVIVFSRCRGENGKSVTQSIGLLSYTFLTATGKEDIVVPMIDFEKGGRGWNKKIRSSSNDWDMNLKTISQWSPFASEEELLQQSYASILYLELPPSFRIILRGKEVEHHDLVKDMMLEQDISYKPVNVPERVQENKNMAATGKIGFVKDAGNHIDVQGFNVYHKNRLIKPFWRVWNAAGSDGRGVIGVLEANFVEPAHDKQGFERTSVLSRLEAKLINLQKTYWRTNCHKIGYAVRRQSKNLSSDTIQSACNKDIHSARTSQNGQCFTGGNKRSSHDNAIYQNGHGSESRQSRMKNGLNSCKISDVSDASEGVRHNAPFASRESLHDPIKHKSTYLLTSPSYPKPIVISENGQITTNGNVKSLSNSKAEDRESRFVWKQSLHFVQILVVPYTRLLNTLFLVICMLNRICGTENHLLQYERDKCRKLESQLQERTNELEAERKKTELLEKEFECLVVMIQEERTRQTEREDELMKKIKDGSQAIEDLRERVRQLEAKELLSCKIEKNCY